MKSKMNTFSLCSGALMAAVICIMTMIVQIPIPLGYAHLGDAFILLTVAFLGKREGVWAGGIGSAMADLMTGYTQWVLPTLLIKSIMGFAIGYLAWGKEKKLHMASVRTLIASIAGVAVMIAGYTIAGAVMNGSIYTGLLQVPGLTLEGIIGMAIFYVIGFVLERANVFRLLRIA